ncbi:MAG: ABC transporter permease [Bacteroidetes bacterium]|nr:ABC transporter permease [Bacteroidota bacterium]
MISYIFKKIIYGFLVMLGVVTAVFFLFNVLPGDPARLMLGQRADQASIDAINKDLGRDKPLFSQFVLYLNDLSPISFHNKVDKDNYLFLNPEKYSAKELLDIGSQGVLVLKYPYLRRSYQTKKKVSEILQETLPETAVLAFSAMVLASFLGIILGVVAALKKNTLFDKLSLLLAVLGMAGPSFFVGLIFAWIFGYLLSDYTGLNTVGSLYTSDDYGNGEYLDLKNLILPAVTLGIRPLAIIVQLTRSSLLDVLSQDYIRTAHAKGLSKAVVVFKHALKNALNPVVTAISGWFASLLAGAIFVEYIFGWKGVGKEVVDALDKYDLPVVMGTVLVAAFLFVLINILVDIIYGLLDPRIRLR